jgi:hypothetical protein
MSAERNLSSANLTPEQYQAKLDAQLAGTARLMALVAVLGDALKLADVYLDGFVWTTEPEHSELRSIKAASKRAQRAVRRFADDQGHVDVESLLARTSPKNVTACSRCGGAGVEISGG